MLGLFMNQLILTLILSLFFNLLSFTNDGVESNTLNQIGMIVLDAETSDCIDYDLHIQKTPIQVYSSRFLSFTNSKLKSSHQLPFLKSHPVRAPPQTYISV